MFDDGNELLSGSTKKRYSGLRTPDTAMISAAPHGNRGWRRDRTGRKMIRQNGYTRFLEGVLQRKEAELRDMRNFLERRIREESEKLAAHEHVMIHQARRAAMGEMLGAIAHQWRQPLNALAMIVQNMKDSWEYDEFDGDLMDHSVSRAMEQIGYMSQTIDDFRNFFRPHNINERFNPKQCVDEVVAMMSGWFSNFENIPIELVHELEEDIHVSGCHNEFKQVILNLLCNARDAVLKQQRNVPCSGRITIRIRRQETSVLISVEDNGGGIDESIMEQIFEPYFTTKETTNGSGIGLYMSRVIIESKMYGSLRAENIPNGALLVMSLPVIPQLTGGADERSDSGCFAVVC